MASVQDFPFELLVLIFKHIYLMSKAIPNPEWYESNTGIYEYKG